MNELRTKFDEDYFNTIPGEWALKPQEDHYWQLMCTNYLDEKGRYSIKLIMSECYDLIIRCHLYIEKRDRIGKVLESKQINIPNINLEETDQIIDAVIACTLEVQKELSLFKFKGEWQTVEIKAFLKKIILFRKGVNESGYGAYILFNEPIPQNAPNYDEDSLYEQPK